MAYSAFSIRLRISSTFQAVVRGPSFTGLGKRPVLIPAHHVERPTGRNRNGKTHLAIAIARSCIREGSRGRFFTTVDLVEAESRAQRQGRIADYLTRLDFVILDELGYLPFAQAGGQLLSH